MTDGTKIDQFNSILKEKIRFIYMVVYDSKKNMRKLIPLMVHVPISHKVFNQVGQYFRIRNILTWRFRKKTQ